MAGKLVIPRHFLSIPYNAEIYPGIPHPADLATGANCQVFAYAILAHFGIAFPPLRSSELWSDTQHTSLVSDLEPLDLLLFAPTHDAYGAHVALHVGEGHAIHLSRAVGKPAIWPLDTFATHEKYRVFVGAKRPKRSL